MDAMESFDSFTGRNAQPLVLANDNDFQLFVFA